MCLRMIFVCFCVIAVAAANAIPLNALLQSESEEYAGGRYPNELD